MPVLDIIKENIKARAEIQTELRAIDEAATTDKRDYSDEEKATIAERRDALQAIDDRITSNLEMEIRNAEIQDGLQRFAGVLADRETGEIPDTRSVGERFAGTEEYRSWLKESGGRGGYAVELEGLDFRAVTTVTTGTTSGGAFGRPERLTRVGRDFLDRKTYLLDLIPHIATQAGSVEYVQDKTPLADIADKPAETAETVAKPQAGPTFQVINEPIATIPVFADITRQTLWDFPQVQGYLDGRMRYGLKRRADKQSINGDGVSPNILGLALRSGILTYAPGAAEARYKSIRHAITIGENNEVVPEIIVLNPSDAETFDLTNDTSAGLHAVMDNDSPGGAAALAGSPSRTAWGLQQVHSTAIAAGTALLIDPMACSVIDRMAPTAFVTDSDGDKFKQNIVTLMLELRMGLALFDPKGVIKVTFNGAT